MNIELSSEQQRLFENVTDQALITFDKTKARGKTLDYLIEMAENCVFVDSELVSLKSAGFEHVAERLIELEDAINIYEFAKK